MIINIVLILVVLWPVSGMVQHGFLYARPEQDHNPLGYLLSMFPGPFTFLVLRYK